MAIAVAFAAAAWVFAVLAIVAATGFAPVACIALVAVVVAAVNVVATPVVLQDVALAGQLVKLFNWVGVDLS